MSTFDQALHLARHDWHVFPLAPDSKRPLANCPTCRNQASDAHRIDTCPCLADGGWCHGVRAATTRPDIISYWWTHHPDALIGVAAGPSRLVLIDIDTHGAPFPHNPAHDLLPGIDLTSENIDGSQWSDPNQFRDGRHSLALLAKLRGGPRPWPGNDQHQPVAVDTPSTGRHLWYRTPHARLRQAIGALAWRVDIKAGWSYGLAPGTTTRTGTYRHITGKIATPGRLPDWLAHEIERVASPVPQPVKPLTRHPEPSTLTHRGAAAYLNTIIRRGTAELATLTDGRKQALAALAYKTGGYLHWSGLNETDALSQLITAGIASGLPYSTAQRIVQRSFTNGIAHPLLMAACGEARSA